MPRRNPERLASRDARRAPEPVSILIVPTRYVPHVGGIETLLGHTLPLLRDRGYDPVIVTEVDGDRASSSVIDGVPVYRLPFFAAARSSEPSAILDVTSLLRDIEAEHDVTLRHVHGIDFNIFSCGGATSARRSRSRSACTEPSTCRSRSIGSRSGC